MPRTLRAVSQRALVVSQAVSRTNVAVSQCCCLLYRNPKGRPPVMIQKLYRDPKPMPHVLHAVSQRCIAAPCHDKKICIVTHRSGQVMRARAGARPAHRSVVSWPLTGRVVALLAVSQGAWAPCRSACCAP